MRKLSIGLVFLAAGLFASTLALLAIGYFSFVYQPKNLPLPPCLKIGAPEHHAFLPNCSGPYRLPFGETTYSTNEAGMRERALAALPHPRLLLVGDSNVEGYGLDFAHTISQQLERSRESGFAAVLNAGVRYSGPLYQYAQLKKKTAAASPAAVLWLLSENDFQDDLLFEQLSTKRDEHGLPVEFSTMDFDTANRRAPAWLESVLPASVAHKVKVWSYNAVVAGYAREARQDGHASCEALRVGADWLKRQGIPLGFVLLPLGPNYPGAVAPKNFQKIVDCLPPGAPKLDLRGVLDQDASVYFAGDIHLNERGVGSLVRKILDSGLLGRMEASLEKKRAFRVK